MAEPSKDDATRRRRSGFSFPWGLVMILVLYAGGVYFYVWQTYWESSEYKAALKYNEAFDALGPDEGKSCSIEQLNRAFDLFLETSKLMPIALEPIENGTQRVLAIAEVCKLSIDKTRVRLGELQGSIVSKNIEWRSGILQGAYERGWTPEAVLKQPKKVLQYSVPGGVLIIVVWVVMQMSSREQRLRDHEALVREVEDDIEELSTYREGLDALREKQLKEELKTKKKKKKS